MLQLRLTRRAVFSLLLVALAASLAFAQYHSFHFAWLSDTHVGGATGEEDLRASVRDINRMDSVAFVLFSGDITELGWNWEFALTKSILDSLNKPYYIIPGNHDTKWSESGCTEFTRVWGTDRFHFEYGGYRFIGLHEGPIMRMGDGHFAPEDLRWMDSVLARVPPEQRLFFVTHYPLDPGLDNWYEMTERLKRFNTQAVLVGHGHANRRLEFEGIPGVMGRSNVRARDPVGGFTIVSIRNDSALFHERVTGIETRPAWHLLPLDTRTYHRDTTRYPRPAYDINGQYPFVRPLWKINTGYTIAAAPAVSGEIVVVGNSSGAVECYSLRDGTKLWTFATGAAVYSTADIQAERVVFGSADGSVYCLRLANGELVWRFATRAPVVACPTIHDGVVYIGASDSTFRALDLHSGNLLWEFGDVRGFVETKPLVYQGRVVFGAWDTFLYTLDARTGWVVWKWSNGLPTRNLSPAAAWPRGAGGKVFVAAPDRFMTALDLSTGNIAWRTNRHMVREAIGMSEDGTRIYAKLMNDSLVAFSSFSHDVHLAWAAHCGYGYDIAPSMPQERGGVVFFGTKNGLVFALDGATGNTLWQHKVSNTIVNTVAPIDGRRVVVTDFDGNILLLRSD